MTTQQLHDAIYANATAKAQADAGNDAGCALTIAPTLPPTTQSTYVNERGVIAAFSNPTDGETAMATLETAGTSNALVARALKWLEPANGGVDVNDPRVQAILSATLTSDAAATLIALANQPAVVSADDVSLAWAQYRTNGRIA